MKIPLQLVQIWPSVRQAPETADRQLLPGKDVAEQAGKITIARLGPRPTLDS